MTSTQKALRLRAFTPERVSTGYDSYQLIFMYLEAVGKGFFSKLNIEPLISLQKMTQKSEKMQISQQ